MSKEELKNIVSEILGNSDESTFNQFIEKIAASLEGNQALRLDGIGHFQIQKEPLSRMERKGEGSISRKEVLLFSPEGDTSAEDILSFEVGEQLKSSNKFSDSIFNVGINKPTVISDLENEILDEGDEIVDELLSQNISELVEGGEVIEGYESLIEAKPNNTEMLKDEKVTNEEVILDNLMLDASNGFTEAEINKEFMSSNLDSETIDDDEFNEIIGNEDYNVASSNVEPEITDEDVSNSEAEILKNGEKIESDFEVSEKSQDGNEEEIGIELQEKDKSNNEMDLKEDVETDDKEELKDEIETESGEEYPTEIEAEIGKEFRTDFATENNDIGKAETNPFDELDDYIKDEQKDEVEKITNSDNETDEELTKELEIDSSSTKEFDFNEKSNEWYKNPVLYFASIGFIVAIIVIYMFLPSTPDDRIEKESNSLVTNNEDQSGVVDSSAASDVTIKSVNSEETTVKKLEESKNVENKVPVTKKNISEQKVTQPKATTLTGLYRDIKNDKSITQRIYFDGTRYTVQSSSWRSTSIAEREVRKLKKRGFDAFVYKVFIASKNGTWNRVRIGYFDTQKEAEEFLKKNKI